jgi:putative tryptophan/tyrosine transport system substrate-binding protein
MLRGWPVAASRQLKSVQDAARAVGLKLEVMGASTERDTDVAFARMIEAKARGLVVFSDPFLFIHREKIVALAAGHALPAIYSFRGFVAAGGLMSYDTSIPDAYLGLASMSVAFLRAKSRPIFRLSSRLTTSSSST